MHRICGSCANGSCDVITQANLFYHWPIFSGKMSASVNYLPGYDVTKFYLGCTINRVISVISQSPDLSPYGDSYVVKLFDRDRTKLKFITFITLVYGFLSPARISRINMDK